MPLNVDKAAALYGRGLSCQQIAARYGFTRGYVSARLRRAGTVMRATGRPLDEHHLDVDALVRLREIGATWNEVATIYGVTRHAVRVCYATAVAPHDELETG